MRLSKSVMSNKAYVTPEVVKWARETAKLPIEEVARKLKVNRERVKAWESGEDSPTFSQIEKLSKYYRRPLAVFFLPEPPEDFQTLRDFRKDGEKKEYSTALTFLIREIQNRQRWLSDFFKAEGESKLSFIGRFSVSSEADKIAQDVLKVLNVSRDEMSSFTENREVLNYWVKKIEDQRVFVSLTSNLHSHLKIDPSEVQGFAISDEYAPFICVNTKDSKNAQLFTLIHELVHLWLNSSGVSAFDPIEFRDDYNKFSPVEKLCNKVTAEILMPKKEIQALAKGISMNAKEIEAIAKNFQVSSYAVAVRFLNLNLISLDSFRRVQKVLERHYKEYLIDRELKKTSGFANPYTLTIRRNSRSFTEYVYSLYKGGQISGVDASNLLSTKINNFNKLAEKLYSSL